MGSIGAPEVMVILVLALLVLGPDRLPEAARTMGRWMHELRKLTGSLQAEVRTVVDEAMRPVNETMTAASDSFTTTQTGTDDVAAAWTDQAATGPAGEHEAVVDPAPHPAPTTPFDPSLN